MINAKAIGFTIAFAIVGAMLLITGCGGGGGGTSYPIPALPANAVVFDTTNAIDIANSAVSDSGYVGTSARQANILPSVKGVIDLLADQMNSTEQSTSVSTGVSQTTIIPCTDDGDITITVDGNESSAIGTLRFNNCTEGTVIVNGGISFDGTGDSAGNFSVNGGGSINITDTIDPTSITMVMNFRESGNTSTGSFSSSFSFSIDGLPGGGFLVETIQPLAGAGFDVTSGEIMVYGGNGTRIRILITAPNTAEVFVDEGSGFVSVGFISL
jgi:hypothetical protein